MFLFRNSRNSLKFAAKAATKARLYTKFDQDDNPRFAEGNPFGMIFVFKSRSASGISTLMTKQKTLFDLGNGVQYT